MATTLDTQYNKRHEQDNIEMKTNLDLCLHSFISVCLSCHTYIVYA